MTYADCHIEYKLMNDTQEVSQPYYLNSELRTSVVAPSTELSFLTSEHAFDTALLGVKNTPENLKMLQLESQHIQWRQDNERARIHEEEMAMHKARIYAHGINKLINRKVISVMENEGEDTAKQELKWMADYMRNKKFGLREKFVSFFARKSDEAKFAKLKQKYFPGVAYEKLVILEDESIPIDNRATAIYAQKAVADQEEKSMFFIQNAYRTLERLHERLDAVDDMISVFKDENDTDQLISYYTSLQGLTPKRPYLDTPPSYQIGEIIPNVRENIMGVDNSLYVQ